MRDTAKELEKKEREAASGGEGRQVERGRREVESENLKNIAPEYKEYSSTEKVGKEYWREEFANPVIKESDVGVQRDSESLESKSESEQAQGRERGGMDGAGNMGVRANAVAALAFRRDRAHA